MAEIHGTQRMNSIDSGFPDFSSSAIVRLKCLVQGEMSQELLDCFALKICTHIHMPFKINCKHFGDSTIFYVMSP